jgi:hypothetical protein
MENFNRFENKEPESREGEKDLIWEGKLKELESITDKNGTPIDGKIKEAVAAFQLNGFSTATSCEGHAEAGEPTPWIVVQAPDKPGERFINEKNIFQKKADACGIPIEKFNHHTNRDAFLEAFSEASEQEETEEYKKWTNENEKLLLKMTDLLDEFYKDRNVPDDIRLTIDILFTNAFCVHNGGEEYAKKHTNRINGADASQPEEEYYRLQERMVERQKEMKIFAEFLKTKYFSEK